MTDADVLNVACAWWLLAAGWLAIRGLLRHLDREPANRSQPASIVPRQDAAPQRQA